MGDVVDLVLVQADALHEIDLDLVSGGKAANQRPAIETAVLRDCQNWRNVVAGMRVVGGQERVVKIELAHGNAVGPCRPFGRDTLIVRLAEHGCAGAERMCGGLRARACHRSAHERSGGHGRVVDDPVADHLDHVGLDGDGIGGDLGDLPGELVLSRQMLGRFVGTDCVRFHGATFC